MKKLYEHSENKFSQFGEDGIIKEILNILNIKNGVTLEIGAWDGFYLSNTANLWSNNKQFKGILIEGSNVFDIQSLKNKYDNIHCLKEFASLDNPLESMIDNCDFNVTNDNFVLASIDIDGDDLNVAKSMGKYKPIILIIEPNGYITKDNNLNPEGNCVEFLIESICPLGYEFIGMSGFLNKESGNLLFIREDFKDKFPIVQLNWLKRGILTTNGIEFTN